MSVNTHNQTQVMSCFEYQRLTQHDFANKQDFEYLLMQGLPCFDVVVHAGKLQLLVKHYLAKIVMPSGISLEILPKLGYLNNQLADRALFNKRSENNHIHCSHFQSEIETTRQWVKQMLVDIAAQNMQKVLPTIELTGDVNIDSTSKRITDPEFNSNEGAPWYDWLLQLAEQKISDAKHLLPSEYQIQVHNTPQAQGKLNLKAQLQKNWHRPHYLHTESSIRQTHALVIQFLATALLMVQQLNNKPAHIKSDTWGRVMSLSQLKWRTVYDSILHEKPNWQGQLSIHQRGVLEQALSWAWWVLNHLTQLPERTETSPNSLPVPALFINMNHAFEQWVLNRLKIWATKQLPGSEFVAKPSIDWLSLWSNVPQRLSTHTDTSVIQRLMPDACIKASDGSITHVIDIKYKNIEHIQDVRSNDWQQLYVYQQQLKTKSAWLIYPMSIGFNQAIDVAPVSLQDKDSRMTVIPFDMNKRMIRY